MTINYYRAFTKKFDDLTDKKLAVSILETIDNIEKASNLKDIKNLKKLKGAANAYRIRIGDYRIGFFVENNSVNFAAFGHRKDIYSIFP